MCIVACSRKYWWEIGIFVNEESVAVVVVCNTHCSVHPCINGYNSPRQYKRTFAWSVSLQGGKTTELDLALPSGRDPAGRQRLPELSLSTLQETTSFWRNPSLNLVSKLCDVIE